MFTHPECLCTPASLAELTQLMGRFQDTVTAYVLFLRPHDVGVNWEQTDLWAKAAGLPGVTALRDADGVEALTQAGRAARGPLGERMVKVVGPRASRGRRGLVATRVRQAA